MLAGCPHGSNMIPRLELFYQPADSRLTSQSMFVSHLVELLR